MATRTKEQLEDQFVYAVACVMQHYGPGLSQEGLQEVREFAKKMNLHTDSTFNVDREEGDKFLDFHERIIWPEQWWRIELEEIRGEE